MINHVLPHTAYTLSNRLGEKRKKEKRKKKINLITYISMQKKSVKFIWIKEISIDLRPTSTWKLQAKLISKENKNVKCN